MLSAINSAGNFFKLGVPQSQDLKHYRTRRLKVTQWKTGRFKNKPNIHETEEVAKRSHASGKNKTGVFSGGFKNGSLWNSDFISFRVLPAWDMRTKPVPTVWVKDLIIQKTKQETPNIKKIKQTFKFNVCLEYNVHLENVSLSEGCEIWKIIGEFSIEKKNIITIFSYLCLCSCTDTQKFMVITSNLCVWKKEKW